MRDRWENASIKLALLFCVSLDEMDVDRNHKRKIIDKKLNLSSKSNGSLINRKSNYCDILVGIKKRTKK